MNAVNILVKHLQIHLQYETFQFQLPTMEKVKVDRFSYLANAGDSNAVIDIKDVISILLDKLEDTYEQMLQKGDF